jgi:hypothetical protein
MLPGSAVMLPGSNSPLHAPLLSPIRAIFSACPFLYDLIARIILREEYYHDVFITQFLPVSSYFLSVTSNAWKTLEYFNIIYLEGLKKKRESKK